MNESLKVTLAITYIAILLAICIALPLLTSSWIHPGAGVVVAIVSMVAWRYLGPSPMPGFVNGLVAIQGLLAIIGVLVVCVIRTVTLVW